MDGTETEVAQTRQGEEELRGIGGWLILIAIGLVVRAISGSYEALDSIGFHGGEEYLSLVDAGNDAYLPGYKLVMLVETASLLLLVAIQWTCLILFFSKSRFLPRAMIVLLIASPFQMGGDAAMLEQYLRYLEGAPDLGAFWLDEAAFSELAGNFHEISQSVLTQLPGAIIGACIWIPYFLKSRRVANTFVN